MSYLILLLSHVQIKFYIIFINIINFFTHLLPSRLNKLFHTAYRKEEHDNSIQTFPELEVFATRTILFINEL